MAIASMVLGIISLVFCFVPVIGFPVSIIGLILSWFALKNEESSMGTAGFIMSLIGLALCIVNSVVVAYLMIL